jgi:hypothetical protein
MIMAKHILAVCFGLSLISETVGCLWIVGLVVKHVGWGRAILYFLIPLLALVWAIRQHLDDDSEVRTLVPAVLMSGGAILMIICVIAFSFVSE